MSNDSHDPLLGKMDALIKKHRGPAEEAPAAAPTPPAGWLPVLTEVVSRGTPPVQAVAANATPAAELAAPTPTSPQVTEAKSSPPPTPASPMASLNPEQLANQLLQELGPKLSVVMEQQVASELRKNLDETVANLLSQLDVSVRDMVRDAVAEKLKNPSTDS